MKKAKTNKKTESIDDKVKKYFDGELALREKLGLQKRLVVLFPHRPYGRPSLLGRILLSLLRSQGGILDTEFSLTEK
ncbi:hypothetical protein GW916_01960 [bacterium]|nr:hypothetical protein [bacterium]